MSLAEEALRVVYEFASKRVAESRARSRVVSSDHFRRTDPNYDEIVYRINLERDWQRLATIAHVLQYKLALQRLRSQ